LPPLLLRLESHLLDSMPSDTLAELTEYVIGRQGHRLPVSRSGILVSAAMDRQRDWLALQDIPKPTIRPHRPPITRSPVLVAADSSAAVSPHFDRRLSTPRPALLSPLASPAMRPLAGGPELDGMFAMDEDVELAAAVAVSLSIGESATLPGVGAEPAASLLSPPASSSSSSKPVWKSRAVEAEK
jgi:inhibitor of Bruton tyrosine kinase